MAGILPNRSAEEESAVLFQDDNFTTSLNSTTGSISSYNLLVGLSGYLHDLISFYRLHQWLGVYVVHSEAQTSNCN